MFLRTERIKQKNTKAAEQRGKTLAAGGVQLLGKALARIERTKHFRAQFHARNVLHQPLPCDEVLKIAVEVVVAINKMK